MIGYKKFYEINKIRSCDTAVLFDIVTYDYRVTEMGLV